jgi:hypothetical protein
MGVARNRRGPAGIGTRSAAAVVAAAIALLAAPGAARAATTCELGTSGGVLDVTMTASGDTAVLGVTSGGTEILVTGSSGGVACTVPGGVDKPRTTNTSAISVHNSSGLTNNDVTIAEAPRFGPGAPGDMTEGVGGAQEIEIFVNLNDGAGSELRVETELASSNQFGSVVRFGSGGINPNDGEPSPDVDIFPSSVPELRGAAIDAPGSILADGGRGTGGPLTMGITLSGGQGNDNLVGGSGPDAIQGARAPTGSSAMRAAISSTGAKAPTRNSPAAAGRTAWCQGLSAIPCPAGMPSTSSTTRSTSPPGSPSTWRARTSST